MMLGQAHTRFHATDDPFEEHSAVRAISGDSGDVPMHSGHPAERALSGGSGDLPVYSGVYAPAAHAHAWQTSAAVSSCAMPSEGAAKHYSSHARSHSGLHSAAGHGQVKLAPYPPSMLAPSVPCVSQGPHAHTSSQHWGMSPTHSSISLDTSAHPDRASHMVYADVSAHEEVGVGRGVGQHHALMAAPLQLNPEEHWKTALHKQAELQHSLKDQLDVRSLLRIPA